MTNQKDIEQWKDEVLDSIVDIQRATPSEDLLGKIKLAVSETHHIKPLVLKWSVAAAIFLVCLNVFAIKEYIKDKSSAQEEVQNSSMEMTVDYNLYSS